MWSTTISSSNSTRELLYPAVIDLGMFGYRHQIAVILLGQLLFFVGKPEDCINAIFVIQSSLLRFKKRVSVRVHSISAHGRINFLLYVKFGFQAKTKLTHPVTNHVFAFEKSDWSLYKN